MQIDLNHLLATHESELEGYMESHISVSNDDPYVNRMEGKIDLLKKLISLGFKVGA